MNRFGSIAMAAVVSALVSFTTFKMMSPSGASTEDNDGGMAAPFHFANARAGVKSISNAPEFIDAAARVTRSIVHIKVKLNRSGGREQYDPFYGYRQPAAQVMASGSGVIITKDGYIVTNNHVVEGATEIQVVLTDKRIFAAKLVGRDPNTDLAVIRIDTKDLTPIVIGNSDEVQIGEWVLAAGYPFSLNTTVTAGIISAKERSIGIIGKPERGQPATASAMSSAVEAYIQTDAAINPGNSGGALVNTSGELIGINAAIASQTGSYEGYGFAIPVNLAQKIVNDLIKYGEVKRGLLGVSFPSPATEDDFLIQQGIKPGSVQGAYITDVQSGSAAAAGGLKAGDIIQKIDDSEINSSVELSERVARHNPGDKLSLSVKRGEKVLNTSVTLKGRETTPQDNQNANAAALTSKLGATFAPLSDAFKEHYRMNTGLVVTGIDPSGLFAQIGIQRGAIILSINGGPINNVSDMTKAFASAGNSMLRFECIMPDGSRIVFNLSTGA